MLVIERTLTNLHPHLLKEALRKVRGTSDDGSVIEKAYLLSKEEKSMMVVGARKHIPRKKKNREQKTMMSWKKGQSAIGVTRLDIGSLSA